MVTVPWLLQGKICLNLKKRKPTKTPNGSILIAVYLKMSGITSSSEEEIKDCFSESGLVR